MYIFSFLCSTSTTAIKCPRYTKFTLSVFSKSLCLRRVSGPPRKEKTHLQPATGFIIMSSISFTFSPFLFFHHIHTVFPSHSPPPRTSPPLFSLSSLCPAVSATRDLFFSSRFFFFSLRLLDTHTLCSPVQLKPEF